MSVGNITNMSEIKEKKISLETLRIIAMCFVIYNHTGENGYELFRYAQNDFIWYLSLVVGTICKAGVPLFFMISGALLLGKEETVAEIFKKRIVRYILTIVIFSFIYYVRLYLRNPEYGFSISFFVKFIYSTPFIDPYWFLYAYLGFLIMLPFLRAAVKNLELSGYILILISVLILDYIVVAEKIMGFAHINLSLGWGTQTILYPVLGYGVMRYASTYEKEHNKITMVLVGTFILNCACCIYMVHSELSELGGTISELSEENIARYSLVPSMIIFYSIVRTFDGINSSKITYKVINYVGGCAFCVYLFEDMLRSDIFLSVFKLASTQVGRLMLNVPYTICMISGGVLIATVIRKIPGFKYLKI